jgi:hypothetical protein
VEKKKLSVREARMELDFATARGDHHNIEVAEKTLEQALAEAEERRRDRKAAKEKKQPAA